MGTKVEVKNWGNSLGIVLPKELAEERELQAGDEIYVEVTKQLDMDSIFGQADTGLTGQEFKDEAREGW